MPNLEPFAVGYPVNFASGGDTTKNAFYKHIQEIEKIYDHLNALNNDKVSNGEIDITSHINASNPHPNLDISTLGGTIPASRITGLPHNGVDTFSKSSSGYINFENGVQLRWGGSGQLTWKADGTGDVKEISDEAYTFNFVQSFSNTCWRVFTSITAATTSDYPALHVIPCGWNKDYFLYRYYKGVSADGAWIHNGQWYIQAGMEYSELHFYLHYFAIGY